MKHDIKNTSSAVYLCNVGLSVSCLKTMYLLHRPAPGPSPCPLHTQQNSGRNGKKPILWSLQSRSSSTRLWWERERKSSDYFCLTMWMFIAGEANPKCLCPPFVLPALCRAARLLSLLRAVTLMELSGIQRWSSRLFRGGGGCVGLGGLRGGDKDLNASSSVSF